MIQTNDINEYNTLIQTTHEDVHLVDTLGRPIKSFCVEIISIILSGLVIIPNLSTIQNNKWYSLDGNIGKFEVTIRDDVRLYSTIRILHLD